MDGHQVGLVSIPGGVNPFDPNQNEGKPRRLIRFDSLSGRTLGRTEISGLSDPVALSPDGARVLTIDSRDHRRLDVYSTTDTAHIAGWRPYDKELPDDEKAVVWADFLSPDRVLTVNRAGVLVLWSLPDCKAVYVAEGACEGAPVLSPGRKYLAAYQGGTFRFLNPSSGELMGEAQTPASASSGKADLRGAAFQAEGGGLVALIGGQQVVRWDLSTGKVTADFPISMTINPGPNSHHALVESCGANHALLDGRILVDLEKRSHIWSYYGPNVSAGGPDGRHWYVAGNNMQNAALTPLALPEENVNRVVAMVNDPAVKPSLRVGMQAAVQLELSGPPKNGEAFRKAITDSLNAKLKANGMKLAAAAPAQLRGPRGGEEHGPQGRLPRVRGRSFHKSAGVDQHHEPGLRCLLCRQPGPHPAGASAELRHAPGLPHDLPSARGRDPRVVPQEQPVERREALRRRHRPAVLRRTTGRWCGHAAGIYRPERGAVGGSGAVLAEFPTGRSFRPSPAFRS